jgi:hypothetical protein
MAAYTFTSELAEQFIQRLLAALEKTGNNETRGLTRAELEAALFASKSRIVEYVRHLRKVKRIYICGYVDMENGGRVPRYFVGNHQDAKPLGKKTDAERWAIIKADPEKHDRRKARLRADNVRNRARVKPVSIFSALGV